ncbi:biotin carboxylase N-terminal domain-containing protein [Pontibacter sp. G13]|uniref:acetyl/propionyl/methylcrotonyl-CoA carboxylase subunit alpha n=1 Tax=Pontibacter sp. G13 TaxID=3074898 RepID=UPI00288A9923|nr:biotin carboxylase N-terminal domain-containing protein [Pontibacter sp. G13]WNJ19823.1 biotin carboxylase N-terminal domain-containing protein [Pontibacter sp. G13]
MIQKILIANRGEIAQRIIRTCRKLGISTVAVYAEQDADSLPVVSADEAMVIPPGEVGNAYLNIPGLIHAAQATGADAIHPGYGFLSERAEFARACREAGLIWIGPHPDAIDWMGDKARSKARVQAFDVPTIPGYSGEDQTLPTLMNEAERIGFPLLLKASAGGGGKGMRIVRELADLAEALEAAKRESQAAFGDDRMLLERYFDSAQHIEFQVFGDQHGQIIHLNERACSIQRRYQKVIEEAPAPGMDEALRGEMGAAAVRVAQSVQYDQAGTVEFILTPSGQFYFLEMNTRLQVEHPVTEAITGLDLVEWQIRVAEGAPLPLNQSQIPLDGHAIECRLYAEDPQSEFLPDAGTMHLWQPADIEHVRYDTAMFSGVEIGTDYDPMLAKIIVHADHRDGAIRKMTHELGRLAAFGVVTNQAYLRSILEHPDMLKGEYDTQFLHRYHPDLLPNESVDPAACMIATLMDIDGESHTRPAFQGIPSGWTNMGPRTQRITWIIGEKEYEWRFGRNGAGDWWFEHAGHRWEHVSIRSIDTHSVSLNLDDRHTRYIYTQQGDRWWIQQWGGLKTELTFKDPFPLPKAEDSEGAYVAPMPGKVVSVMVEMGQEVSKGDPLVILSSMKMENTLYAHQSGKIAEVRVEETATVAAKEVLLVLAPHESPES